MKPLNIALSILPVLAVAIGLITWVVTLRADLDVAKTDIASLSASQSGVGPLSERLVAVETNVNSIPDTTAWRNDMGERIVAIESVPSISVKPYDDSWLLDKFDGLDSSEKDLAVQNEEAMTQIRWMISEYGPAIDNLRNRELDTDLNDKLSDLSREVSTVTARVEGLDVSGYGDIASRLGAMEAIVSTINGGEIDLTPLVTRIAELEGLLKSIPKSSNRYDDSTLRRQVATIQGSISSLQTTVRNLPRSSGSSYDDSTIRRQVGTLQSSVSSLESSVRSLRSSGGSGTSYNDSAIRTTLQAVQRNLASLETTVRRLPTSSGTSYNDSALQSSVSSLQSNLSQLQGQVSTLVSQIANQPTAMNYSSDISMLNNQMSSLDSQMSSLQTTVNGLSSGIDYSGQIMDLENWLQSLDLKVGELQTTDSTQAIEDLFQELATIYTRFDELEDGLGQAFDYVFQELQSLREDLDALANESDNNNTGNVDVPEKLYVTHSTNPNQYDGTYVLTGSFNGFPKWECEECDGTSGQFAIAYLYRHPVGFTASGYVWVVQPIPPSTEWMANSYLDADWPWNGTNWSGDVTSVTIS